MIMNSEQLITESLYGNVYGSPCNYNNPRSLGSWFRRRRAKQIMVLLEHCYQRYQRVDILDIGGRANYWNIIPQSVFQRFKMKVTLVNDDEELKVGKNEGSRDGPGE